MIPPLAGAGILFWSEMEEFGMRKAVVVLVGVTVLASFLVSGCGKSEDVIKIGAAGPFTGDLSKIGLDSLNAIKMAVHEFNQAGGVDGRMVEIVVGDDGGDPAKGNVVADKFISDESILGIVGPMNSSVTNAALPAYDKANLVLISQSSTTSDLTDKGYSVMHRICPRDDAQGKAAAVFILNEVKPEKLYILDDKTTYGQGLASEVEKNLKDQGFSRLKRDQIAIQDKDFSAVIGLIKSFGADMVYMAFSNPAQAANLAKQLASADLRPALMAGDGCMEKDQLIGGGGDAVSGMYLTSIGRSIKEVSEAQEFVRKFESQYGAMSIFSGQTYESTKVLLEAIRVAAKAGELTRQGVQKAVHETKDFQGILGFPISFDSKGDIVGGEIFVLKVDGGDFSEVKKYVTGNID